MTYSAHRAQTVAAKRTSKPIENRSTFTPRRRATKCPNSWTRPAGPRQRQNARIFERNSVHRRIRPRAAAVVPQCRVRAHPSASRSSDCPPPMFDTVRSVRFLSFGKPGETRRGTAPQRPRSPRSIPPGQVPPPPPPRKARHRTQPRGVGGSKSSRAISNRSAWPRPSNAAAAGKRVSDRCACPGCQAAPAPNHRHVHHQMDHTRGCTT